MGRGGGAGRSHVLSGSVGRGSCHPTFFHHDCDCADRGDGRPCGTHLAKPRARGARGHAGRARSGRAPEFSDVVCRDACARGRLSGWRTLGHEREESVFGSAGSVLGHPRDNDPGASVADRRTCDYSLRGLPFSSARSLWGARQPAGDADRIDLGHASGSPCAGRDAFRLRRAALAFDGWRHRMDECDRSRACPARSDEFPHLASALC